MREHKIIVRRTKDMDNMSIAFNPEKKGLVVLEYSGGMLMKVVHFTDDPVEARIHADSAAKTYGAERA